MMRYVRFLFVIIAFTLSACGGGGGSDASVADERPSGNISGVAFDGLIISGDVKVYDFSGGRKGSLLGSTRTDGNGLYSLTLTTSDKPVLIEVDGGYYLEEASGKQVQVDRELGYKLMAVEYYESGKSLDIAATFFSTIATGYAEYLIGEGVDAGAAIEMAYQEVDGWAGFDTRKTIPVDVSNSANVTPYITDAHRYGFVAGAISYLTYLVGESTGSGIHDSFTSINFIGTAYRDISSDGVLDGKENGLSMYFGDLILDSNVYRELLAVRMLQFSGSDSNLTGLDFDDVLPFASRINLFAGNVFGSIAAPDIGESAPTIEQFLPSEGETINGSYPASAIISDTYGIESVSYYVDDQYVGAGDPRNPTRPIDTLNFANGLHEITIVATNLMGNPTQISHSVNIYNGTISFSATSNSVRRVSLDGEDVCPATIRVIDGIGLGVDYIKVNGEIRYYNETMQNGYLDITTFHTSLDSGSAYRTPRCPLQTIEVRDALGNIHHASYGIWFSGSSCYVDIGKCRY